MRAFCLTLPELPHRKERAKTHFRERGVQVEFFDGIHAEKFGLRTVFPYEIDHPGSGFNIGYGPTGCWLSHWCLWSALTLVWEDHFLILEDDAKFDIDWHTRTLDALNSVPKDYDMLFLGSCCCEHAPKKLIKNQVWEVKYPACTHAYIVAKKALPVILATQRKLFAPIDLSLGLFSFPHLRVYTVLPTICGQWDTVLQP